MKTRDGKWHYRLGNYPHPISLIRSQNAIKSVQFTICHARNHRLSRHATRRRPHLVYLLKNLQLPPQVWLVSAPKRKWLQRDKLKVRELKYRESKTPTLFGEKSSLTTNLSYPLSLLVKWWHGFTTASQLVLRPKFQIIQKFVPSHWPTRRHGYLQRTTIPVRPRGK